MSWLVDRVPIVRVPLGRVPETITAETQRPQSRDRSGFAKQGVCWELSHEDTKATKQKDQRLRPT